MAIKDDVYALLKDTVAHLGYELIEVTYQKLYGNMTLTLYIDCNREGGVGLDDCEKVSRAVDPILDAADPTKGAMYHLNVSSPGLDRPIKTERDFVKKQGTLVEASLYAPLNGVKKVQGTLTEWGEQTVTLTVDGKEIKLNKKDIAVLKPVIVF
jgi:ribosome maturation factor RimP